MPAAALTSRERSARAIAELIEQLSRTLASGSFIGGLNPAQWGALRYIAQANETARSIGAFAKHHLITPSSASQTIQALVNKKLVSKERGADRRSRYLRLTSRGQRLLEQDPIKELAKAIMSLSEGQMIGLADALVTLIRTSSAAGD